MEQTVSDFTDQQEGSHVEIEASQPQADAGEPIAVYVAGIRAQLAPIGSRSALLDSYRRESLNLLVSTAPPIDAAAAALEIAYTLRWLELPDEQIALATEAN